MHDSRNRYALGGNHVTSCATGMIRKLQRTGCAMPCVAHPVVVLLACQGKRRSRLWCIFKPSWTQSYHIYLYLINVVAKGQASRSSAADYCECSLPVGKYLLRKCQNRPPQPHGHKLVKPSFLLGKVPDWAPMSKGISSKCSGRSSKSVGNKRMFLSRVFGSG